jgi:hypothetical protein
LPSAWDRAVVTVAIEVSDQLVFTDSTSSTLNGSAEVVDKAGRVPPASTPVAPQVMLQWTVARMV